MLFTVMPNMPRLRLQLRHLDPAQRKAVLGEIFTLLRVDQFRERRQVIRWLGQILFLFHAARRWAKAQAKLADARDKGKKRRNYWYARMAQLAEEMRDDPHARYLFSPDFREEAERLGGRYNPTLKPAPKSTGPKPKGLHTLVGNVAMLYTSLTGQPIAVSWNEDTGTASGPLLRLARAVCTLFGEPANQFTDATIRTALRNVKKTPFSQDINCHLTTTQRDDQRRQRRRA
jgi:hypothetical protein